MFLSLNIVMFKLYNMILVNMFVVLGMWYTRARVHNNVVLRKGCMFVERTRPIEITAVILTDTRPLLWEHPISCIGLTYSYFNRMFDIPL